MLKGHSEHPASSSLSFYDKLRHSTIWWRPGTITPVIISRNPFHLTSAVDAHYSRQEELQHALQLWWRRHRSKKRERVNDRREEGRDGEERRKPGLSRRQGDNKSKETMQINSWTTQGRQIAHCEWCTSIKYHGHLQTKIKWPLCVSTPWPTPLLLPH